MALKSSHSNYIPLAERMRPATAENFFGQQKLVGPGKFLTDILGTGAVPSLILWGPPGTGKTTLARIIATSCDVEAVFFSAVLAGVKEVRKIIAEAKKIREKNNRHTFFFIDEIHRFNKGQQDAFLPHVESGLITLIGATTENPSFQIIAPLLSRCRVVVLESLSGKALSLIIDRAINDVTNGLGSNNLHLEDDARQHIIGLADGDGRTALNILEIVANLALQDAAANTGDLPVAITVLHTEAAGQGKFLRYDKNGEEHYNIISALHKSLRDSDPDGALYWLYRMLEAGEDPLYICRRLIRFASEDVGVADPQALVHTMQCREAYNLLGLPEGKLAIAQAVVYLATAPKSNSLYMAESQLRKTIRKTGCLAVPKHLRNAPTTLMKKLDYGKGYQYAHDLPEGIVSQHHLPKQLEGINFYQPTERGYEAVVKDRLNKWHQILQQRAIVATQKKREKNEN